MTLVLWGSCYLVGAITAMCIFLKCKDKDTDAIDGIPIGMFWPIIAVIGVVVGTVAVIFYLIPKGIINIPAGIRWLRQGRRSVKPAALGRQRK